MGWLSSKVFRSLSNAIQHILVPEEAHCSDPFWLSRCPPLLRDKGTLSEAILMPLKSSYARDPQNFGTWASRVFIFRSVCVANPLPGFVVLGQTLNSRNPHARKFQVFHLQEKLSTREALEPHAIPQFRIHRYVPQNWKFHNNIGKDQTGNLYSRRNSSAKLRAEPQ